MHPERSKIKKNENKIRFQIITLVQRQWVSNSHRKGQLVAT